MAELPDVIRKRHFHEDDLLQDVYPTDEIGQGRMSSQFLRGRAILTLRNDTATAINDKILDRAGGVTKTYHSTNKAEGDGEVDFQYPTEFLQGQTLSSLPTHELKLKETVPVMPLRKD